MKNTMIIAGMLLTGSINAFAESPQPTLPRPVVSTPISLEVSTRKPVNTWEEARFDTLYERIAKTLEGDKKTLSHNLLN